MTDVPDSIAVDWPVGPEYPEWVDATGAGAWVAYKLRSAGWFIDRLDQVGRQVGFARFVGVEMALDGALAALCGAFDASSGGIIEAVDAYFDAAADGAPDVIRPQLKPHQFTWARCWERLDLVAEEGLSFDTASLVDEVNQALLDKEDKPMGWLTEVKRLRNAAIHQNTLARHIDADVGRATQWSVTVGREPGRSAHPVDYLRRTHERMSHLCARMVEVMDTLCPNGYPTSRGAQSVTIYPPAGTGRTVMPAPKVIAEDD